MGNHIPSSLTAFQHCVTACWTCYAATPWTEMSLLLSRIDIYHPERAGTEIDPIWVNLGAHAQRTYRTPTAGGILPELYHAVYSPTLEIPCPSVR